MGKLDEILRSKREETDAKWSRVKREEEQTEYFGPEEENTEGKAEPPAELVAAAPGASIVDATEIFKSLVVGSLPSGPLWLPLFDLDTLPEVDRAHVPNLEDVDVATYRPNAETLYMFLTGLAYNIPTFNFGGPGTGKSTMAKFVAGHLNWPFAMYIGNSSQTVEDVLGSKTVENGDIKWEDGSLVHAVQNNYLIMFDEISFNSAEFTTTCLQKPLEAGGSLIINARPEPKVAPGPLTRWVATDNTRGQGDMGGHYSGTQPLNNALLDRFGLYIEHKYLTSAAERKVLKSKVPEATETLIRGIVEVGKMIRRGYDQGEFSHTMSLRPMIQWATLATSMKDIKSAFNFTFGNRLEPSELGAAQNLIDSVFNK